MSSSRVKMSHSEIFGAENMSRDSHHHLSSSLPVRSNKRSALETLHVVEDQPSVISCGSGRGYRRSAGSNVSSFEIYRDEETQLEMKEKKVPKKRMSEVPARKPKTGQVPATKGRSSLNPARTSTPNTVPRDISPSRNCSMESLEWSKDFIENQTKPKKVSNIVESIDLDVKQKMYLENFSPEKFLRAFPDPWSHFGDKTRDCSDYSEHSLHYLKSKFRKHYNQIISDSLTFHNNNLYLAYKYLMKKNPGLRLRSANRSLSECNANKPTTFSPDFLAEVMFIENEEELKKYVKSKQNARKNRLREAMRVNALRECGSCLDGMLTLEDVVICPSGHTYCKSCLSKYVTREATDGNWIFGCMSICPKTYSLKDVQHLVQPDLFAKIVERCQVRCVPSPELEDLVHCPHCFQPAIMSPPEAKTLRCSNPRCFRDTCRLCQRSSHEPVNCEDA